MKRLTVLGSTGSVGRNTLDVAARHPGRFEVVALAAGKNDALLLEQCIAHQPRHAVLANPDAAERLRLALTARGAATEVHFGPEALERIVALQDVDAVMAAIVGAAGLPATIAAARAGKEVLLANKEALVMSGALFMTAVAEGNATLLPVDSEHSAILQALPRGFICGRAGELERAGVRRILLTASLFGAPLEAIQVVVHPQSVIHSMVEYLDGSVIAQMGAPDMRTPIACALAWPGRIESGAEPLDFATLGSLEFERIDALRFPCVALAREAIRRGGTAPAALNAANEIAVEAFLAGRLHFTGIAEVIENVLEEVSVEPLVSLDQVYASDIEARALASRFVSRLPSRLSRLVT